MKRERKEQNFAPFLCYCMRDRVPDPCKLSRCRGLPSSTCRQLLEDLVVSLQQLKFAQKETGKVKTNGWTLHVERHTVRASLSPSPSLAEHNSARLLHNMCLSTTLHQKLLRQIIHRMADTLQCSSQKLSTVFSPPNELSSVAFVQTAIWALSPDWLVTSECCSKVSHMCCSSQTSAESFWRSV